MPECVDDLFVLFALDFLRAFCTFMVMRFQSHRDIIDIVWGGELEAYARDVGANFEAARMHHLRNSIASDYWPAASASAQNKGFNEVTTDLLAQLKPPRKRAIRNKRILHEEAAA